MNDSPDMSLLEKSDMIQRTPAPVEDRLIARSGPPAWKQAMKEVITDPETLLDRLGLDRSLLDGMRTGHRLFSIRIPRAFADRMEYGNPADPLLRQVLPLGDEAHSPDGYVTDPLEEGDSTKQTGLIRKYQSRALLMVTGSCAVNCRYCFRRHFPYDEHRLSPEGRRSALETLAGDPAINEVIFSGGDPLVASDRLLADWAQQISAIDHIKRIRIHTRLPVVIPERVDDSLINWLEETSAQIVVVVHINHANEIDQSVRQALTRLRAAGALLLNQSVILQGVNDRVESLCDLSEALFDAGVLPYYLHAFDPVAGAAHFDVSDRQAGDLVAQMQARLPGFLVPKLVREIPGEPSKTLLPASRNLDET